MIHFKKQVEHTGKAKLISININDYVIDRLKKAGMDGAIGHVKNLNLINKKLSSDTNDEVRSWLKIYLIDASKNTMGAMFGTTLSADLNFRDTIMRLHPERFVKVSKVTSLGPVVNVTLRLYFEQPVIEALTQAMIPGPQDDETLASTATELMNMTYTAAKSKLNDERGYQMPAGLPALVNPKDVLKDHGIGETVVIPMTTPLGGYFLEIEFLP